MDLTEEMRRRLSTNDVDMGEEMLDTVIIEKSGGQNETTPGEGFKQ